MHIHRCVRSSKGFFGPNLNSYSTKGIITAGAAVITIISIVFAYIQRNLVNIATIVMNIATKVLCGNPRRIQNFRGNFRNPVVTVQILVTALLRYCHFNQTPLLYSTVVPPQHMIFRLLF